MTVTARGTRRMKIPPAGIVIATAFAAILAFAAPTFAQVPVPRPSPKTANPAPATAQPPTASGDQLFNDSGGSGDAMNGTDAVDGTDADAGAIDDSIDPGAIGDYIGQIPPDIPDPGPPRDIRPGSFTLEARLTPDGPALKDGVTWRIFGNQPGSDGRLPLLGNASGGVIYVRLDPGTYYIYAAFGHAGLGRKIEVKQQTGGAVFPLDAGGMRLLAVNGKDVPLSAPDVNFDIYAPDENGSGERYLLLQNIPPGKVIALNAGIYHVVSHYGDANAIVRADIRVDAGKLTDATVYQKAARLTLKLVDTHGGEALADTAWTVVTPAGDSVVESVGAFPTVTLAAGDYTAIAKHDGKTFRTPFKVEATVDRDVEVLDR